jgi:hypothetical protein
MIGRERYLPQIGLRFASVVHTSATPAPARVSIRHFSASSFSSAGRESDVGFVCVCVWFVTMKRQRNNGPAVVPATSRAEEEMEKCLKLKEMTRNRLKLTHPPESRTQKTTREIFKILDLQPLPRKPKIKPFSDRITNPFHDFSDKPKARPSEKPRMPLQAALDFVKRQTEWLSRKNLQETEELEPLDDLNLEEVCDLESPSDICSSNPRRSIPQGAGNEPSSQARSIESRRRVKAELERCDSFPPLPLSLILAIVSESPEESRGGESFENETETGGTGATGALSPDRPGRS